MNNLQVSFYTEAGSKRGMGHLIRCYTIYQKFKDMGIKSAFFLDSDVDYRYKFNDIEYFKWEEFTFDNKVNILFIDSYKADIELYNKISKCVKVPVYIDDYGRLDYPRGLIINFAPEARKFFKSRKDNYHYLLGLDFIPLRKEFLDTNIKKENQLFIMLGGSDIANLSLEMIDILKNVDIKKIIVSNNELIKKKLSNYKNVEVLYKPNDIELIKKMLISKFAISTASMTIYELAYCQIPTIILAVDKNQELGAKQLIKYNLAVSFIDIKSITWKNNMLIKVNELIKSNLPSNNIVDGRGTQRIVDKIIKLAME